MPIEWFRQPTGDEETRGATKTAKVTWVATNPLTPQEAISEGLPVAYNDSHPDYASSSHKCNNIRIVASGFRLISVEATYSVPQDNTEHKPQEPSETNPKIYSWATIQESVQVDRDSAGNALLYSSGRPATGITETRNYKRLTITRWESSYNLATAQAYENTVNSATFEGAAVGAVKCAIIQPSSSYTTESALIPIDYTFDFKSPLIWGDHPHQAMFKDQDSIGTVAGETYTFVGKDGTPVGNVPLDATGKPVISGLTYFAKASDAKPQPTPTWDTLSTPTGATVITAGSVKLLRYATLPSANFNALGL